MKLTTINKLIQTYIDYKQNTIHMLYSFMHNYSKLLMLAMPNKFLTTL